MVIDKDEFNGKDLMELMHEIRDRMEDIQKNYEKKSVSKWISKKKALKLLECSEVKFRSLMARGEIKTSKDGNAKQSRVMVYAPSIDEYFERHTNNR